MSRPLKAINEGRRWNVGGLGTGLLLCWLVLALILSGYVALIYGFPPATSRAAVLVVFTVASWALGIFKEPVTTLLLFLFGMLFAAAPAETLFAGFASPAWWLVFGGGITGIAVRRTGLAQRCSDMLLSMRANTYRYYVSTVVFASVALAFVMPSTTGRVLLLTPIALTLSDRLGLHQGRRGRTGIVMAVAAASYMPPTAVLPANIPNSVLLGVAQQVYGIRLHYAPYLLLHFPLLGVAKSVLLIWLICWLFPGTVEKTVFAREPTKRFSSSERTLIAVLVLSPAVLCN